MVLDAKDPLRLGPVVSVALGVDRLHLGRVALGVRSAVGEVALKALSISCVMLYPTHHHEIVRRTGASANNEALPAGLLNGERTDVSEGDCS